MAKILLIEDDPVSIEMIRTRLKEKDYQVIVANNGKEGIRLAEEEMPDLILMDMILPGMHGLEATIKLKENPETKDIPVIALTAMGSTDFVRACYKDGICAFVKKPYDFKELFTNIEKFIKNQNKTVKKNQKQTTKKILIINDDPALETMITMSLKKHGYQTISAPDVMIRVDQIKKIRPDLILLDIGMPENWGFTVFENLKKSKGTVSIPVILITDQSSSAELKEKVTQLKAEDYIPKPFGSEELIHKIQKTLEE